MIGRDRLPSYADRTNCPYTQAVILEAIRLGSPGPLNLPHWSSERTKIGNYTIPKGYHLLVNFYAIHHDEKYWPQPYKFEPTRFLSEDGTKVLKKDSFMPFSVGKRSCPGEALAQIELFMFTASILQRLKIEPTGNDLIVKGRLITFNHVPEKSSLLFKSRK